MIQFDILSGSNFFLVLSDTEPEFTITGSFDCLLTSTLDQSTNSFEISLKESLEYGKYIFQVSGSSITPNYTGQYIADIRSVLKENLTWSQANLIYSQTPQFWSNVIGVISSSVFYTDRAYISNGTDDIPVTVYTGGNQLGTFKTYHNL